MSNQVPLDQREKNSRLYGMLCHLLALSALVGVPFGNILGPLIIWIIKKDEYPFVDDQGKESLNFQISLTIYGLLIGAASVVLLVSVIGILLLPALAVVAIALWVFELVIVIIASLQANDGIRYRYPLTIRFIV